VHDEPPHTSTPTDTPLLRSSPEQAAYLRRDANRRSTGRIRHPLVLMHLRAPDRSENTQLQLSGAHCASLRRRAVQPRTQPKAALAAPFLLIVH
jgi:hypothetical protein